MLQFTNDSFNTEQVLYSNNYKTIMYTSLSLPYFNTNISGGPTNLTKLPLK